MSIGHHDQWVDAAGGASPRETRFRLKSGAVFPSTANAPGIEGRTTGLCKLLVDQHPLNDRVPWGRCRRPAQVAAVVIAAEMTAEQFARMPFCSQYTTTSVAVTASMPPVQWCGLGKRAAGRGSENTRSSQDEGS